jgi:hypothetical protein
MKDQAEYVALNRIEGDDDEQHLLSSQKAHLPTPGRKARSSFVIFLTTAAIISFSLLFASLSLAWKNSSLMSRINQLSGNAIDLSNVKHGQDFPPPPGGFVAVTEIAALNKNPPQRWMGNGPPKETIAPVSIDIIDDSKPDEIITEPENVVINNNVRHFSHSLMSAESSDTGSIDHDCLSIPCHCWRWFWTRPSEMRHQGHLAISQGIHGRQQTSLYHAFRHPRLETGRSH